MRTGPVFPNQYEPNPPSRGRGFLWLILALMSAASLAIAIWTLVNQQDKTELVLKTDIESMAMIGDPEVWASTYVAGCTNKTIGTKQRKFTKKTYVATGCPSTYNQCTDYICNIDRECEEVLLETSGCSEDFDCFGNQTCNTQTCQCELIEQCETDLDCPASYSTCFAYTCEDGTCNGNLTDGSQCYTSSDCGNAQICDDTCQCVAAGIQFVTDTYTPTFTNQTIDMDPNLTTLWDNYTDINFIYTLLPNDWIQIEGTATMVPAGDTRRYLGFFFSLPPGFAANTGNADPGDFQVSPNSDLFLFQPAVLVSGDGVIRLFDANTAEVICWNNNPSFDGGAENTVEYFAYFSLTYQRLLV